MGAASRARIGAEIDSLGAGEKEDKEEAEEEAVSDKFSYASLLAVEDTEGSSGEDREVSPKEISCEEVL
jgi:hypothetical protein